MVASLRFTYLSRALADVSEVLAGGATLGQVDGSAVAGGEVELALSEGVDDQEASVDQ